MLKKFEDAGVNLDDVTGLIISHQDEADDKIPDRLRARIAKAITPKFDKYLRNHFYLQNKPAPCPLLLEHCYLQFLNDIADGKWASSIMALLDNIVNHTINLEAI